MNGLSLQRPAITPAPSNRNHSYPLAQPTGRCNTCTAHGSRLSAAIAQEPV